MPTIQFSQLGNFGRFGNQMFQYAFARSYAEKYNAILEIPNWIGEKIFKNVSHPPISKKLHRTALDHVTWGKTNIDFFGYFQFKQCYDLISEGKLRQWFKFQDKWLRKYNECEKVVGHLRRGDFEKNYSGNFCIITDRSYIKACEKYMIDSQYLQWLSEENPTIDKSVDVSYTNQNNSMYGHGMYEDNGISFLPDFFKMINARVLLRANSTFSFWAGFFNKNTVLSPLVGNKTGLCDVEFVKGNYPAVFPGHCDIVFGA